MLNRPVPLSTHSNPYLPIHSLQPPFTAPPFPPFNIIMSWGGSGECTTLGFQNYHFLHLPRPRKGTNARECARMRAECAPNGGRMHAICGHPGNLWGAPTEPECKAGFRASLSQGGTKLTFGSISNKMVDERRTMHPTGVCLQLVFNELST